MASWHCHPESFWASIHIFLLQKQFTHTCFVAKTIYAHFFVAKSILAHFFVAKMIYAHFFCRKNDLSAVFVTKTIYTLCSESFCALIFFLEVKNRKETENGLGVMVAFSIQSVQDFIVFETPLSIKVNHVFSNLLNVEYENAFERKTIHYMVPSKQADQRRHFLQR